MEPTTQDVIVPPVRPKNWLVESILVTVFCCLVFGIIGIVYAAQVNSKYDAGDYQGALKASAEAGKWTKIGLISWVVLVVLWLIAVFVLGMGATFLDSFRSVD